MEPRPQALVQIRRLGQDLRRRPHPRQRRQQLVQGRGQMRVMRHPVVQRRHRPLQCARPRLQPRRHRRPARIAARKLLQPLQFRPGPRQFRRRRPQVIDQRRPRPLGQRLPVHPQRFGQLVQNLRRHLAAVVLDQVQVTGRNPRRRRHIRLPQPRRQPPLAQPRSDQGIAGHRRPPGRVLVKTLPPLQPIYKTPSLTAPTKAPAPRESHGSTSAPSPADASARQDGTSPFRG